MEQRHVDALSELLGEGYVVKLSPVIGGGLIVEGPDYDSFTSSARDKAYVCWLIDDRLTRKALLVNTVFGPKGTVYALGSAVTLGQCMIEPVTGQDQLEIRLEALYQMKEPVKLQEGSDG